MKFCNINKVFLMVFSFTATLSGCATNTYQNAKDVQETKYSFSRNVLFDEIAEAKTKVERDQAAILAMQDEYYVDFHFQETVVLDESYQKHKPKDANAYEMVVVVKNIPGEVVLQHLLVSANGHVIKHWRQDWRYEAKQRFEFVDDQTWRLKTLDSEKTQSAWTQCVYEVSDAPRYCGTGRWNHRYGVSTWTSDRTWRPLPRREYTVRDDYNVINAENRHTVTALGWTHEQDNTKTIRENGKSSTLVREFGFNNYRRIAGFRFQPAYEYWEKTAAYWERVRMAWAERLAQPQVVLKTEVDGMPIIKATFEHADDIKNNIADYGEVEIEAVLNEWVQAANSFSLK